MAVEAKIPIYCLSSAYWSYRPWPAAWATQFPNPKRRSLPSILVEIWRLSSSFLIPLSDWKRIKNAPELYSRAFSPLNIGLYGLDRGSQPFAEISGLLFIQPPHQVLMDLAAMFHGFPFHFFSGRPRNGEVTIQAKVLTFEFLHRLSPFRNTDTNWTDIVIILRFRLIEMRS